MSRFCGYTREQEPKKHARKKKTDEEKEVKRRTESKDASMGQEIEPETRTDSSDSESDIEEVDQHGAFLCTKCRVMGRDGLNFQRPPNALCVKSAITKEQRRCDRSVVTMRKIIVCVLPNFPPLSLFGEIRPRFKISSNFSG